MSDEIEKKVTTIGLTQANHDILSKFKEDKIFHEMMDGYRFAIAYSINRDIAPSEISEKVITKFNVGSLDPKNEIYNAILALNPNIKMPVYKYAELLAESGMTELAMMYKQNSRLDIAKIVADSS